MYLHRNKTFCQNHTQDGCMYYLLWNAVLEFSGVTHLQLAGGSGFQWREFSTCWMVLAQNVSTAVAPTCHISRLCCDRKQNLAAVGLSCGKLYQRYQVSQLSRWLWIERITRWPRFSLMLPDSVVLLSLGERVFFGSKTITRAFEMGLDSSQISSLAM